MLMYAVGKDLLVLPLLTGHRRSASATERALQTGVVVEMMRYPTLTSSKREKNVWVVAIPIAAILTF